MMVRSRKKHYCIEADCHITVSGENRRCRSHAQKHKWQTIWKGRQGETVYYCIEENCGKKVSGRGRRCQSCAIRKREAERSKRNYMCKEWLEKHYLEEMLSLEQMAEKADCGVSTLRTWMDRHGIARRSHSAAMYLALKVGRHKKGRKIYHCIGAECNVAVTGPDRRCRSCAQKHRLNDPSELARMIEGVQKAWENGAYDHIDWSAINTEHWQDEEARHQCSKRVKQMWQEGIFGEERNRQLSEAIKAAWVRGDYDGVFQSPTSIELELMAALDIMGIEHQPQYRPDSCRFIFDEYVPGINLLIEADGDYWHSTARGQQQDAHKDIWAAENGFNLLRISESDIREYGAWSIILREVAPLSGIV